MEDTANSHACTSQYLHVSWYLDILLMHQFRKKAECVILHALTFASQNITDNNASLHTIRQSSQQVNVHESAVVVGCQLQILHIRWKSAYANL